MEEVTQRDLKEEKGQQKDRKQCGSLGQQEVVFMGPEIRVPGDEETLKVIPLGWLPLPWVNLELAWHPQPAGGSLGDPLWEALFGTSWEVGQALSCVSPSSQITGSSAESAAGSGM